MFDPNSWILEEMTVNELWEGLEESNARLEDACKESPMDEDKVRQAVMTVIQFDKELEKRGAV